MRKPNGKPGEAAFSLIELLVVIAIISILISILLPTLSRVWRTANVLACPIVYAAQDDTVWICDPAGNRQMQVSNMTCGSPPAWSPGGDRIAFFTYQDGGRTIIVNPSNGQIKQLPPVESPCWIDNNTLLGTRFNGSSNELYRINVHDGTITRWKALAAIRESSGHINAQYDPIMLGGFLVAEGEVIWVGQMDIVLRGKDWQRKRPIWQDPGNDVQDHRARADESGQWVAWTRGRSAGADRPKCVAVKPIKSSSTLPPDLIATQFPTSGFCDWTPDSNLLISFQKSTGQRVLAVMDRYGEDRRELDTPHGLQTVEGCAAWRRYKRW